MNIKKKIFQSLSTTINTFYVLLIVLFAVLTGSVLYIVANQQVSENTAEAMDTTLTQKIEYISFLYRDIFEQFYELSQDVTVQRLANSAVPSPQSYLELSERTAFMFERNSSFIDSIYININNFYIIEQSEQQALKDDFDPALFYEPTTPVNEGYYWLNNHTDPIFDREQEVHSIVYLVTDGVGEPAGVIVLNLKTSFIERTLADVALEGGYMMMLSPEGYFVPKDVPDHERLNEAVFRRYQEGSLAAGVEIIDLIGLSPYRVVNDSIGTNKWAVTLAAPRINLMGLNSTLPYLLVGLTLLLAVAAALILRMIRSYISNPIQKMAQSMMTTESYNEKLVFPDAVPEELAILYDTYNYLTDRNVHLIEEMTANQKEKMELEVALLHAQINPHFLYNTLYSIKGLSDMGMNAEASEMISKLSDFFRTSLSRGRETITISEELKNISSYLYMMEMRYGDYFQYRINIPEEWHRYYIVKLTLQPLVENAIYHGVMHDRGQGLITIGCMEKDEDLVVYVEDNGQGIEPEKLTRIQAEIDSPYLSGSRDDTGVGLRSVDIRVKNRYGAGYGLTIESELGKGTKVAVRIPKVKGDTEDV